MATGRRPFDADSPAASMSAILRDAAPPLASLRTDVPAELERVISACLEKDPGARPKSALEIFAPPGRPEPRTDPAARRVPVVVVLPFVNRSADPGKDYFSEGLTEQVITDLARIEALRVISRNSAMALKGTTRDTPSIARELTPSEERKAAERPIQNVVAYDAYLRAQQPDPYRAHGLAPNDANVLTELVRFSQSAGLRQLGPLLDRLLAIDPLTPVTSPCVSTHQRANGNWEESAAAARRSIRLALEPSLLHALAGWEIATAGFRDEGAGILRHVARVCAGTSLGALTALSSWPCVPPRALPSSAKTKTPSGGWARRSAWASWTIPLTAHAPFLAGLRDHPEFRELMGPVKERWQAIVEWERQHRAVGRAEVR